MTDLEKIKAALKETADTFAKSDDGICITISNFAKAFLDNIEYQEAFGEADLEAEHNAATHARGLR